MVLPPELLRRVCQIQRIYVGQNPPVFISLCHIPGPDSMISPFDECTMASHVLLGWLLKEHAFSVKQRYINTGPTVQQ